MTNLISCLMTAIPSPLSTPPPPPVNRSGAHYFEFDSSPPWISARTGRQDTGSMRTGRQDTGSMRTGRQDTGSMRTGRQDIGSMRTGGQDPCLSSVYVCGLLT
eukprot:GHVU01116305.1.p3 GENE.GHVU01116305.1~~GHVU01116305.1.p3  ORF type:complete len:103 (-),score=7.16 GHVU01116305.1:1128-1436(-)